MLIMQVTMIQGDQQQAMSLILDQDQSLGAAKGNPQFHYQVLRQNIEQQQWQLKNARDYNNF